MKTNQSKYNKASTLSLLNFFLQGAKGYFVLCIIFAALSAVFDMVSPQIIRITIDDVFGEQIPTQGSLTYKLIRALGGVENLQRNLWILALGIIISALLKVSCQYLFRVTNSKASETFLKNMRDSLFKHLEHLPFQWHSANHTGDILQRCTSDIDMVKNFFAEQMTALFRISLFLISSIYFMARMNITLTLISLIPTPIIFVYSYTYFKQVGSHFRECDDNEGILSSICQENLTGIRVVRAFGREQYELNKFKKQNAFYTSLWENMSRIMSRYWSTADFLSGMQIMLVVVLGAYYCVNLGMTSGEYLAFVSYNYKLVWPIRMLGRMISEMSKAGVSVERIKHIMDAEEETSPDEASTPDIKQDIVFDHVSFSYGNNKVLDDVSFKIPCGSTLGILGGTGSGKSTLMMLLDKLYLLKEGEGSIYIGATNINDIDTGYLRANIGFVLQETFLFSKTISENIGIRDASLDLEAIRTSARAACLDEAVMEFANGYDTSVGERGVTLSGGQKQRVSIARMLTQNAPIMIFDDSFSAVDTETDSKIRSSLEKRFGSATIIIISHRITTLSKADNIIVLEHGKIQEQGSHEFLVSNNGIYHHIYEIQSGIEEAISNE